MKCPVCNDVRMREVEKNGIMIDVCPDCKGVWLDRGELDKLMTNVRDFRTEYEQTRMNDERMSDDRRYDSYDNRRYDGRSYRSDEYYKRKKKKSVFDIFDDLF